MSFKASVPDLDWNQDLPAYWYDHSPFKTHFLNSLSLRFFYGEKFFIDTMLKFKDDIKDPELLSLVNEFIKQESIHRVVHKAHGKWLESKGYPATEIELQSQKSLEKALKLDKDKWLLFTVCLEHLTTVFGEHWLTNLDLNNMHPHFRKMWIWHAVEELEHTSVATDLMQHLNKEPKHIRISSLILSFTLMYNITKGTIKLLKADKQLWKLKTLTDACRFFFSPKHGLYKVIRPYFRIMKKDFQPVDQSKLIMAFEK
jgi:predicted metal-dependent hydrolase